MNEKLKNDENWQIGGAKKVMLVQEANGKRKAVTQAEEDGNLKAVTAIDKKGNLKTTDPSEESMAKLLNVNTNDSFL